MTHVFLADQVEKHKGCWQCRRACFRYRGRKYAFCMLHLATARKQWHKHVLRCKASGRCINCPAPPLPGEQRCTACKEVNRRMCLAYSQANPERGHEYWLKTRSAFVRRGFCICKGHPPLPTGFKRCDRCRRRHRRLYRGSR